jgi:hypothetical protein
MSWINPASTSCVAVTRPPIALSGSFFNSQALDGVTKIIAGHGNESDPWAGVECRLEPHDTLITGDQNTGTSATLNNNASTSTLPRFDATT